MTRGASVQLRRAGLVLTVGALLYGGFVPSLALATVGGPYTHPFYTTRTNSQPYGETDKTFESAGHGFAHWHNGIDWSMPVIGTDIAASFTGTVQRFKEDLLDGHAGPYGTGNYVYIEHSSLSPDRFSLYYHLTHNGVLYGQGTVVSAGQHIAESGNTGISTAPHLHYSLMSNGTCQQNDCGDVNPNLWTTGTTEDTGRPPFLVNRTAQSNATIHITQHNTASVWVDVTNEGGRTWYQTNDPQDRGRIYLISVTSDTDGNVVYDSPFVAPSWENNHDVTVADSSTVPPDGSTRFSFNLKASPAPGTYTAYFNLRADALFWFDFASMDYFHITIVVDPDCSSGC